LEDFSSIIQNSLNAIFSRIFSSLDNSFYSILDNLAFINTSILDNNVIKALLGNNINTGILAICNSFILAFILYYSLKFLFSHLIYVKTESPKEFIFKAIIFSTLMNNSLWICEQIIFIIDLCTTFLISTAEELFQKTITFSEFLNILNTTLFWVPAATDLFSFSGIVKSFSSIGLINLVFTFSLRYIMILIFILISPFAFLSLLTNSSSWIFKTWIKSFVSLLLYQLIIGLLLIISFTFTNIANSLLVSIFYVGIIQAFQRTSFFIKELLGGINISVSNSSNSFSSFL
jgi:hypothetical protein